MNYQFLETPIGTLRLVSDGTHLRAIEFEGQYSDEIQSIEHSDPVLATCARHSSWQAALLIRHELLPKKMVKSTT